MPDALNIGTSALLSLQRAITTTGQNIANANTEGYSRQRVEFATLPAQLVEGGFAGSGVRVAEISRSYDQFLAADTQIRNTSAAGAQTLADLSGRVDNILADPATGLSPALDGFFSALQDVANNPASLPERQVLIGEARVLADRFQYLDGRFSDLNAEVNTRIDTSVRNINSLAQDIASLNDQITRETIRAAGRPPNDLLDARDTALFELSRSIGVTTTQESNGSVNVFIGTGQALVVGSRNESLTTFSDPFDAARTQVGISGLAAQTDLGRFLTGGELGAALTFRDDVLDSARGELGVIAAGLTANVNAQQGLGLDLNGAFGLDFFRPTEPGFAGNSANTGSGDLTLTLTDAAQLTGDAYELSFDGSDYTLLNVASGASQTGAGPTFAVDGFEVTVSGSPDAGDSFLITPTAQAASRFAVALSDPRSVAAAGPLVAGTPLSNAGNAVLSELRADSAAGLPLTGTVTLSYNAGTQAFDVTGIAGGPIAYDPATDANGIEATLGGFSFTLSGVPDDGDSFTIDNNSDGLGDNRNALALVALQSERALSGGSATYQDAYATLVADVGVRTRQAGSVAATEGTLLEQSMAARDSAQGVNLDEEAANLIRYQQAYQAAAQVIAIADELFQTLINATSR